MTVRATTAVAEAVQEVTAIVVTVQAATAAVTAVKAKIKAKNQKSVFINALGTRLSIIIGSIKGILKKPAEQKKPDISLFLYA